MHPTKEDQKELYAWYKKTFSFDDDGSIDPYFQHHFTSKTCWIHKEHDEIVSMLCAHPHPMVFHDAILPIRFISGVMTKTAYQHKGHMKQLLRTLFEKTNETTALYVLQAYNPHIYASLDFTPRYFIKEIAYQGEPLPFACKEITSAKDCALCARQALSKWEGWIDHDEHFYRWQIAEAQAQHRPILGLYQDDTLVAFARWIRMDSKVAIEELCAIHEHAKAQLLGQLASCFSTVTYPIPVTAQTPDAAIQLMVRMGNASLCSTLLHREIHSLEDIYHSDQPYYHYGWW